MRCMTSAAVATVRVPGTTANLGSGFDTLGLAVAFYNRAKVRRRADRRIEITSPIAEASRAGALAMLEEAAGAFFKKTRRARFGADIHLSGDVPIARGLGSSVTARLGCVAGLNALCGSPLDRQGLLEVVATLEGQAPICKRLRLEGDRIILESRNPHHKPIEVPEGVEVECFCVRSVARVVRRG